MDADPRVDRGGAALVRLEVSDTGIGIERTALANLFNPYTQADGSTTRKYGGTGLGLAISRQLVTLTGGQVGAESEPGQGSCFWFDLPLPRCDGNDAEPEEERELAGLRVLVVDDNDTSRKFLEQLLGAWQMSCEVADNAAQAMDRLQSASSAGVPYALALLDLNMPAVGGSSWPDSSAHPPSYATCGWWCSPRPESAPSCPRTPFSTVR